jgi:WD40 repeat protein
MSQQKHLVISVHGIWTLAPWQARLRELLAKVDPNIVVHEYKFRVVSFYNLSKQRRRKKALEFANVLLSELRREHWDRVDIVAHSLGSYIVTEALTFLYNGEEQKTLPKIETLILAGSVLQPTHSWQTLVPNFVSKVVNDCGINDVPLLLSELFVPGLGFAGRVGFDGLVGHFTYNRYFSFGHSGFSRPNPDISAPGFMEKWWIPLLTQARAVVPIVDAREKRSFPRLIGWLERQINYIRLLVLFFAIGIPLVFVYFYSKNLEDQNRTLLADGWALRSMQVSRNNSIESAKLAIAAAQLNQGSDSRRALMNAISLRAKVNETIPIETSNERGLIAANRMGTLFAEIKSDFIHREMRLDMRPLKGNNTFKPTSLVLPSNECSLSTQPLRVTFSKTGHFLVVEAMKGSCVLDVTRMKWTHDLPGYEHISFSNDESVFFAATSTQSNHRGLVTLFTEDARVDVTDLPKFGWVRDLVALDDRQSVFTDALGRVWYVDVQKKHTEKISLSTGDVTAQVVSATSDNSLIAIGTENSGIFLIDRHGLHEIWHVQLAAAAKKIIFSDDGKKLATLLADGSARVLSTKDGAQLTHVDGRGFPINISFLGTSGDRLLTVNRDSDVKIWSSLNGDLLTRLPMSLGSDSFATDSIGRTVLTYDSGESITSWNSTWQSDRYALQLEQGIRQVIVRGNGRFVAALGENLQLRLWDTQSHSLLLDIPPSNNGGSAWNSKITLSENGDSLALLDSKGEVKVWKPKVGLAVSLKLPRLYAEYLDTDNEHHIVRGLPRDTDSRLHGGCNKDIAIVDPSTDLLQQNHFAYHRNCGLFDIEKQTPLGLAASDLWRGPIALSTDGGLLAVGFLGDVIVFDTIRGNLLKTFPQGYDKRYKTFKVDGADFGLATLKSIEFTNDSKHLVVVTGGDPIWGDGGNVIRRLPLEASQTDAVKTISTSADDNVIGLRNDSNFIYSISKSGNIVRVWDASTFQLRTSINVKGYVDQILSARSNPKEFVAISHDPTPGRPLAPQTPYIHADLINVDGLYRSRRSFPFPIGITMIHPDNGNYLVENGYGDVQIFDRHDGKKIAEFSLPVRPTMMWLGPNGRDLFYTMGASQKYDLTLSGENQISSILWQDDDLVRHLCSTLRMQDRDFSSMSRQAGRDVGCRFR